MNQNLDLIFFNESFKLRKLLFNNFLACSFDKDVSFGLLALKEISVEEPFLINFLLKENKLQIMIAKSYLLIFLSEDKFKNKLSSTEESL